MYKIQIGHEYIKKDEKITSPVRIPIVENKGKIIFIQKDNDEEEYYFNPYMFIVGKNTFLNTFNLHNKPLGKNQLNREQLEEVYKVMLKANNDWNLLIDFSKESLNKIII